MAIQTIFNCQMIWNILSNIMISYLKYQAIQFTKRQNH